MLFLATGIALYGGAISMLRGDNRVWTLITLHSAGTGELHQIRITSPASWEMLLPLGIAYYHCGRMKKTGRWRVFWVTPR